MDQPASLHPPSGTTAQALVQNVTFTSSNFKLAANMYIPANAPEGRLPAIAVSHPASGVKEQTAAIYASRVSQGGFITLAWDAAYNGESEGQPRGLEDPAQRVEDIKSAVTFLSNHERVDPGRIAILGICASGGYVTVAAAVDRRIKVAATVSGADIGPFFRQGFDGKQDASVAENMLREAAKARTAAGNNPGEISGFPIFPPNASAAEALGPYVYEGWEYYNTSRGFHSRSAKTMPWSSVDKIFAFDGFQYVDRISPRPILMIVGTEADTKWMAEEAYQRAKEPKELFWVEGATHVGLYDKHEYVTPAVSRLIAYYQKHLEVGQQQAA
ncbi:alpha/beta-hydrolase [Trichoderma citrinoviride]|uniref:Alpha/beta-hydrolase n=1 Tax=Trichoderma citrinoviride TaxID=58853 RepID=A0A2T4B8V5_9HYPO|nr:alpha/beta-hydrolase [Trichoderma citrinoviride]PTB65740.1 alpha/beta-hydrolase [Trichoderma citrinoviride]